MLEVRAGVQVGRYFPPWADAGIQDLSVLVLPSSKALLLTAFINNGRQKQMGKRPDGLQVAHFFSHLHFFFFFLETIGPAVHIYNSIDNLKVQLSHANTAVLLLQKKERMGVSDC